MKRNNRNYDAADEERKKTAHHERIGGPFHFERIQTSVSSNRKSISRATGATFPLALFLIAIDDGLAEKFTNKPDNISIEKVGRYTTIQLDINHTVFCHRSPQQRLFYLRAKYLRISMAQAIKMIRPLMTYNIFASTDKKFNPAKMI